MNYAVVLEPMPATEGIAGGYYAHVPAFGLTTHGVGTEGALEAVRDLLRLWIEERRSHGEAVAGMRGALLTTVEID